MAIFFSQGGLTPLAQSRVMQALSTQAPDPPNTIDKIILV